MADQPTVADWKRLGERVKDRRVALCLPVEALVNRGGPSHQTVRNIERGIEGSYRLMTFRKLERALQWPAGTSEKILSGEDLEADYPFEADDPTDEPVAPVVAEDAHALRVGRLVLALWAELQEQPR